MRTLHTDKIIEAVKEMCISANLYLAEDMDSKIRQAAKRGRQHTRQADLESVDREYGDCRRRSDTNLSGYRNGSVLRECRTGSAH